jgi:hypothetical protein
MDQVAVTSFVGALDAHQSLVEALDKASKRYARAVKQWLTACRLGEVSKLPKLAQTAEEAANEIWEMMPEALASWQFDAASYLDSGAWREDLQAALDELGVKYFPVEPKQLLVPPVAVRAQPGFKRLMIGKRGYTSLRPSVVANHLKGLTELATSERALQQFLESLYQAAKKYSKQGNYWIRFREVYNIFCLAPGWKADNPEILFGQRIHQLWTSNIRTTRNGSTASIEQPTEGKAGRDYFTVVADNGMKLSYHAIWFK